MQSVPDSDWCQRILAVRGCQTCPHVDPRLRSGSIDLVLSEKPGKAPMERISKPRINFGLRRFLALFEPELSRSLHLGRVFMTDGTELEDYATFIAGKPLPIRGTPPSVAGWCDCGRIRYYPGGEWYVVGNSLTGQPVYEAWPCNGLVVTPRAPRAD